MIRRLSISLLLVAFSAAACSPAELSSVPQRSEVTTVAPQPELPPPDVGGAVDRTIELVPGDLDDAAVEEKLSGEVAGYVAGSGTHLASFDGLEGRMDIFSFVSGEARGGGAGEKIICRAVAQRDRVISGFGCTGEPAEPPRTGIHRVSTESGDGTTTLLVGVGVEVESVLVEFDTGRRWRIIPVNGIAYAEWPWGIGTPLQISAVAADGTVYTTEF